MLSSWGQRYGALHLLEAAHVKEYKIAFDQPIALVPDFYYKDWARGRHVIAYINTPYGRGSSYYDDRICLEGGKYVYTLTDAIDPTFEGQIYDRSEIVANSLEELVARLLSSEKSVEPQPSLVRLRLYRRTYLLRFLARLRLRAILAPHPAPFRLLPEPPKQALLIHQVIARTCGTRVTLVSQIKRQKNTTPRARLPCLSAHLLAEALWSEKALYRSARRAGIQVALTPTLPASLLELREGAIVTVTFRSLSGQ